MARGILTSYSKLLAARESRHRPAILGTILALCLFFFQANGAVIIINIVIIICIREVILKKSCFLLDIVQKWP